MCDAINGGTGGDHWVVNLVISRAGTLLVNLEGEGKNPIMVGMFGSLGAHTSIGSARARITQMAPEEAQLC